MPTIPLHDENLVREDLLSCAFAVYQQNEANISSESVSY